MRPPKPAATLRKIGFIYVIFYVIFYGFIYIDKAPCHALRGARRTFTTLGCQVL